MHVKYVCINIGMRFGGTRLANRRIGKERKGKNEKYLIHKSKQMFNNEIKSKAENCFDTLKQMGEIHFCSTSIGLFV